MDDDVLISQEQYDQLLTTQQEVSSSLVTLTGNSQKIRALADETKECVEDIYSKVDRLDVSIRGNGEPGLNTRVAVLEANYEMTHGVPPSADDLLQIAMDARIEGKDNEQKGGKQYLTFRWLVEEAFMPVAIIVVSVILSLILNNIFGG